MHIYIYTDWQFQSRALECWMLKALQLSFWTNMFMQDMFDKKAPVKLRFHLTCLLKLFTTGQWQSHSRPGLGKEPPNSHSPFPCPWAYMNSIADEAIFREVLCQAFCVLPRRRWSSSRLQNPSVKQAWKRKIWLPATYHELRSVSTSDVPLNFRKVTLDSSIFEKHPLYFWIHLQHLSVVTCAIYQDTWIWVPSTLIPAGCLNVWNSESNQTWLSGKHSQFSSEKTIEEIMCGWIVIRKP